MRGNTNVYRGNAGVLSGLRVAPVGPEQSGVNVTEDMSAVSWLVDVLVGNPMLAGRLLAIA